MEQSNREALLDVMDNGILASILKSVLKCEGCPAESEYCGRKCNSVIEDWLDETVSPSNWDKEKITDWLCS